MVNHACPLSKVPKKQLVMNSSISKPYMKTYQLLTTTLRRSTFSNPQRLQCRRTFMMTTRLSKEPRRFAPLGARVDKGTEGLPRLKGIVFDVDGTLWWVWFVFVLFWFVPKGAVVVRLWEWHGFDIAWWWLWGAGQCHLNSMLLFGSVTRMLQILRWQYCMSLGKDLRR